MMWRATKPMCQRPDRPLTAAEQAEIRQLSTWARITATSFNSEYELGDLPVMRSDC